VSVAQRTVRAPVVAVAGFAALVVLLTFVVGALQRGAPRSLPWLTGPAWLDGWIQYDSGWYYTIATEGYAYTPGRQSSIAFFPTYPLLVRGVALLLGDTQLAGMLLTVVAGAAAVALFALWAGGRLSRRGTFTAVLLLLFYPYSFFLYGTMYADAVFLLTVVGAFVLLERGHPWLAGLVGILATAGRPVGIAVLVGLVVRSLEIRAVEASDASAPGQHRPSFRALLDGRRHLRLTDAGVLLSGLGLAGWCIYLWLTYGDPFAFVAVESAPGWEQGSGWRTWLKVSLFGQILHGHPETAIACLVQGLMCLAAVLLLRRVWRRFGWGYLAYALLVVGIPILGSKDFMGCGRYVLAAFPVFAAGADLLVTSRHRWLRPVVVVLFAAGLVAGTALYATGFEVS
jgi:hypothetical protein